MSNNMACDLEKGVCGILVNEELEIIDFNKSKEVIELYYVTDPICSYCWALEPVFRKFVEQYGHYFKLNIIMGGLLESWDGFADGSNAINKPFDVAGHWREVGEHYRMPIDGSLWFSNPIKSSYPPSRVFKIIQQIDNNLASKFLRSVREEVFVFNKNVAEEETLVDIVNQLNLNGNEVVKKAFSSEGEALLNQDFDFVRKIGVSGFPTIIMMTGDNKGVRIGGAGSLQDYVNVLKQVLPTNINIKANPQQPLSELLEKEVRLFSKEIEVMYDLDRMEVNSFIEEELSAKSYVRKKILGEFYIQKK